MSGIASGPTGDGLLRSPANSRRRLTRVIGIPVVCAIALVLVAIWISSRQGTLAQSNLINSETSMQNLIAGVPQHGNVLGSPAAPVTVTEFADLQCPYCDGFTLALLPSVLSRYVRPGLVKLVFRNFPFLGADSLSAARVAVAAGAQNKLWQFADAFYYHQLHENSGYVSSAFLRAIGSSVAEVDVTKLMADSRTPAARMAVDNDLHLARVEHINAAPTFLITRPGLPTQRVVGVRPLTGELNRALGR